MSGWESLLEQLDRLDWDDRAAAHAETRQILANVDPSNFLESLKGSPSDAIPARDAVEKTTHYKWLIGKGDEQRFELWLHEYKPSNLRRPGHATVPHNHRFWLTSLILRGGFSDTRYARFESQDEALVKPVTSRPLRPGETMVIDPDEIHSLSELEEGTLSMVVQSQPIRSYSEVFENGEVRRYSDLEAKRLALLESL
jgi:predicted metal-dependent enzyme (double-stranded beta helix superfamily)